MILDLTHANTARTQPLQQIRNEIDRIVYPLARFASKEGIVRAHDSFGWAIANPAYWEDYAEFWDNPEKLIWITGGFGTKQLGYSANAACKIRAAAREGWDTLCFDQSDFRDTVQNQSDLPSSEHQWGDFPHGGAVYVEMNGINWLVAVSCLEADEDCIFASLVATATAQAMHRQNLMHLIAA